MLNYNCMLGDTELLLSSFQENWALNISLQDILVHAARRKHGVKRRIALNFRSELTVVHFREQRSFICQLMHVYGEGGLTQ